MDRNSPPVAAKGRFTLLDYLLFGIVIAFVFYAVYRVNDVLVYQWNWERVLGFLVKYDEESQSWVSNLLLQGLATTLRLAIWATLFATLVGVVMGYWRTCQNLTLRIIARCYVELIRNMPPVVFIFIFYFFVSSQIFPAMGIDSIDTQGEFAQSEVFYFLFGNPALFSNFLAGMICLALFEGAYITEIVRAGIQSTPTGQWEAARAIGLSHFNALRDVVIPQAIRKILPPLAGQFITLIKDSAIISLISIQELTFIATEVAASTTRVFETWILVGLMYFGLCYSFAVLFAYLEKRAKRSDR
ncbi:MAG: ABC transporter permease subunit [Gammaproteobacteria bacterium]|nr:ABC transporter permease subunit [Gammaproteobacteria bacterium]